MNLKRNITLDNNTPLEVILCAFKCCNIIIPIEKLKEKKHKRLDYYNNYNQFFELKVLSSRSVTI